jgi:hypothetical protein
VRLYGHRSEEDRCCGIERGGSREQMKRGDPRVGVSLSHLENIHPIGATRSTDSFSSLRRTLGEPDPRQSLASPPSMISQTSSARGINSRNTSPLGVARVDNTCAHRAVLVGVQRIISMTRRHSSVPSTYSEAFNAYAQPRSLATERPNYNDFSDCAHQVAERLLKH